MTRLFHGFTILAGTCALTLIVGCGGSSTPKVKCDGGGCSDAKRDTSGIKYDGSAVTQPDGPAVTHPDGPTVTQPDGPTVTPDGPAVTHLDGPTVTPDGPAVTHLDGPTVTPDGPAVTPPDGSADVEEFDTIPANKDVQPLLDVRLDVPAADVAQDLPTVLYDVAPDSGDALEAGDATETGEAGD
jgi:hypothetical protein